MRLISLALLLLAGCTRLGFEPADAGADHATSDQLVADHAVVDVTYERPVVDSDPGCGPGICAGCVAGVCK